MEGLLSLRAITDAIITLTASLCSWLAVELNHEHNMEALMILVTMQKKILFTSTICTQPFFTCLAWTMKNLSTVTVDGISVLPTSTAM